MPTSDRLKSYGFNLGNSKETISILDNSDENFTSTIKRSISPNDKDKNILAQEENTTYEDIVLNGNFHAVLKPGERLIIKKERMQDIFENIFGNYSQNTSDYATIISREINLTSDTKQCDNIRTNILFEELNKEYQLNLHKLQSMEIDIDSKNKEINKLRLNEENIKGVLAMLKQNSFKLIPNSILVYMIIVSMALCFFLTCFTLDIFTSIKIIHPFISFTSAIFSFGLLLTALASIKDIKNTYLKNIK